MAFPVTPRTPARHHRARLSSASVSINTQLGRCIEILEETMDMLPVKDQLGNDIQSMVDTINTRIQHTNRRRVESTTSFISTGLETPTSSSPAKQRFTDSYKDVKSIPISITPRSKPDQMVPELGTRQSKRTLLKRRNDKRPTTPPGQILDDEFVQRNMVPAAPRRITTKRKCPTDSEDEERRPRRLRWN